MKKSSEELRARELSCREAAAEETDPEMRLLLQKLADAYQIIAGKREAEAAQERKVPDNG